MPVISNPVAYLNNLPINSDYYQPSQFFISAVTLGQTTTVTTSVNNNYVVGQQVRLLIPNGYGCTGLNGLSGYVISLPAANQVQISINSSNQNAFISAGLPTQAQIVAIGDVNYGYVSTTGLSIPFSNFNVPGSFINISPL